MRTGSNTVEVKYQDRIESVAFDFSRLDMGEMRMVQGALKEVFERTIYLGKSIK